jgi:hypothetical protein
MFSKTYLEEVIFSFYKTVFVMILVNVTYSCVYLNLCSYEMLLIRIRLGENLYVNWIISSYVIRA